MAAATALPRAMGSDAHQQRPSRCNARAVEPALHTADARMCGNRVFGIVDRSALNFASSSWIWLATVAAAARCGTLCPVWPDYRPRCHLDEYASRQKAASSERAHHFKMAFNATETAFLVLAVGKPRR